MVVGGYTFEPYGWRFRVSLFSKSWVHPQYKVLHWLVETQAYSSVRARGTIDPNTSAAGHPRPNLTCPPARPAPAPGARPPNAQRPTPPTHTTRTAPAGFRLAQPLSSQARACRSTRPLISPISPYSHHDAVQRPRARANTARYRLAALTASEEQHCSGRSLLPDPPAAYHPPGWHPPVWGAAVPRHWVAGCPPSLPLRGATLR